MAMGKEEMRQDMSGAVYSSLGLCTHWNCTIQMLMSTLAKLV